MGACSKASTVVPLVLLFSLSSQNLQRLGQQIERGSHRVKHNIYVVQRSSSPCALLLLIEHALIAMLSAHARESTVSFDESTAYMVVATSNIRCHSPAQVQSAVTTFTGAMLHRHQIIQSCVFYVQAKFQMY